MKLRLLLLIFPITTLTTVVLAHSQNSFVVQGSESDQHLKSHKAVVDTTKGFADAYSINPLNVTGWYQRPGQMPVFVPDSGLTESMPIFIAPNVDSKMVIPMGGNLNHKATDPE